MDQVCDQAMHAFCDNTFDMGAAEVGEGVLESFDFDTFVQNIIIATHPGENPVLYLYN